MHSLEDLGVLKKVEEIGFIKHGGEIATACGRRIKRFYFEGALQLRDLSLTSDDGCAIVGEADIAIAPGEKVLVVGESGTGKSTLVRAIAGLWPWGEGEVRVDREGLFVMPQRPYVPLGTLRRAVTYPLSPETVDDNVVRQSVEEVGLGHFIDRLDADEHWDQVLSGGEKQRLGFARMLIQGPSMIIMDEATAALDGASQDRLMALVLDRLPAATLVSVAHRVELEAFHTRKLVLEYGDEGARLVDEALQPAMSGAAKSRDKVRPMRRPRPAPDFASAGLAPTRAHEVVEGAELGTAAPALAASA